MIQTVISSRKELTEFETKKQFKMKLKFKQALFLDHIRSMLAEWKWKKIMYVKADLKYFIWSWSSLYLEMKAFFQCSVKRVKKPGPVPLKEIQAPS